MREIVRQRIAEATERPRRSYTPRAYRRRGAKPIKTERQIFQEAVAELVGRRQKAQIAVLELNQLIDTLLERSQ